MAAGTKGWSDLFERFTDSARSVIVAAQESARALGHEYIGTEHLFLGLLNDPDSVAGAALAQCDITHTAALEAVAELIGPGEATGEDARPFTPRAKKILELSLREALGLGHGYIGTEHLLLGLLRDPDGLVRQLLTAWGVDAGAVREATLRVLAERSGAAAHGETLPAGQSEERTAAARPARQQRPSGTKSMLEQYATNLTARAKAGELDPVIGRDDVLDRVIRTLVRRTKNNPVLVGEPGVGKTAIVEGLAQRIVAGQVPTKLAKAEVFALDLAAMVAGTRFRGDFEERLKKVVAELLTHPAAIVFIDELHTLVGAGGQEGQMDAANILKPLLARGQLRAVGATTLAEYRKYIEKDAALERRFQPVKVAPPTVEESVAILSGLRRAYEEHHELRISDNAIEAAVRLSDRYISDRFLPDKAFDLLDEAAARAALAASDGTPVELGAGDVAAVLAEATGVPVAQMTEAESLRLLALEDELHGRVIGQQQAVSALARAIRRSRSGLKDPKRPTGSFIFAGPTGVGKTELAKALAEQLFGSDDALIAVDMSEYGEKHTVARLFGAPPGYVGFEEGGQLTEKVRRRPFSVVLLDEIEKAHPDVFNALLQVFDEGRLTDSAGRVVDFKNTVVIMTTNLGSRDLSRGVPVGFAAAGDDVADYERMRAKVDADLKVSFRPEFLNRIDEVVVFSPLTQEQVTEIVDLFLASLAERLADRGVTLEVSTAAKLHLAAVGYDPVMGARPLRRVIQRELEDQLADRILSGEYGPGSSVVVDAVGADGDASLIFARRQVVVANAA
jgi:ATP-dependent Clp protease ATP-binding subunit ClpC